jgi:hypothetical protein
MVEIQKQILLVKEDIRRRFPECAYTIRILLWDDDTSLVECRYGTVEKLHISRYYNGELQYEEVDTKFVDNIMISETGLEYFPRNNF